MSGKDIYGQTFAIFLQIKMSRTDIYSKRLERVHIFQVKTSLKFFDNSEKKISTQGQLLLIAS